MVVRQKNLGDVCVKLRLIFESVLIIVYMLRGECVSVRECACVCACVRACVCLCVCMCDVCDVCFFLNIDLRA